MSTKYKATEPDVGYFVTLTTVGWVDVFTRPYQKDMLIKNLQFCQKEKGLEIYAYCIMSNHFHMLCKAVGEITLPEIMRDFKKFTSKEVIKLVEPESRREWMLKYFEDACYRLKRNQKYKVWQDGYHAEQLFSQKFILQKLNYTHNNPVKERIVAKPEDYLYSSARDYTGQKGDLEVVLLDF
ncbi:REP-associated tyrosine transposase [Salinimicrobium soli]|uniref:REP-associated tyrosine transposase n=1 Tax=Salinimicrobium soli TaxID=1254399 RepID=UPI003AABE922